MRSLASRHHPQRLVRPLVVVLDPGVQPPLGVFDRIEDLARQELGEPMLMPFWWQVAHSGALAEPGREHLPVVREDLIGHAEGPHRPRQRITHRPRLLLSAHTTFAEITTREQSSSPDTIFASDPSAILTPPTMSICHNSIGRKRSHRM